MRFNSIEHLQAWQRTGRFPAIHDAIAAAVNSFGCSLGYLDLCCSFGLLGQRLIRENGCDVVGVDIDADAIAAGQAAGIKAKLIHMPVKPDTLKDLVQICQSNTLGGIVARRALPELFGHDLAFGETFTNAMADAGIKEIFIEGRVATRNATNPLSSIDKEVALLGSRYKQVRRVGAVSYLVLK